MKIYLFLALFNFIAYNLLIITRLKTDKYYTVNKLLLLYGLISYFILDIPLILMENAIIPIIILCVVYCLSNKYIMRLDMKNMLEIIPKEEELLEDIMNYCKNNFKNDREILTDINELNFIDNYDINVINHLMHILRKMNKARELTAGDAIVYTCLSLYKTNK